MMDPRWQSTTHVQQPPEVWGGGCECWVTPESMWLSAASCGYGGGYEPASQIDYNPECPMHGKPADPDPVPLSAISEHLRTRLVELVLDQVSAGHWTALDAAEGLSSLGFCASAEKVKAAMGARDRMYEALLHELPEAADEHVWLVSRLARPVGTLTKGRVA